MIIEKLKFFKMDLSWIKSNRFLKIIGSYIRALTRLFIWTILVFFSGLQRTLFMRSEVAGVDLKIVPLKCDIEETDERLAYIDKLCMENPELVIENDFDDNDFPNDEGDEF